MSASTATRPAVPYPPATTSATLDHSISVGVQAARAASAKEATQNTLDEILEITEDFAAYIALRSRGITVATRERRRLRTELERVVVEYINATSTPRDLQENLRPAARVAAISEQHETEEQSGE